MLSNSEEYLKTNRRGFVRLPKFRYMEPKSIKEASTILLDEPGAKILAGGTDILPNMKHRVECPEVLVNIKRIADLD